MMCHHHRHHEILIMSMLAVFFQATQGFSVIPSVVTQGSFTPWASAGASSARGVGGGDGAVASSLGVLLGRRAVSTAMSGRDGEETDDEFLEQNSIIPDSVGASAIQAQLDAMRRKREGVQGARHSISSGGPSRSHGTRGQRAPPQKQTPRPPYAVWVLVFNGGTRPGAQRGLYCLWAKGFNSVVAFEGREGSLRYSLELKAQGLGMPAPTRVAMKDLHRFCEDHSFGLRLVPVNVVPVAPDRNKAQLGFEAPPAGASDEGSVLTPEDLKRFRDSFERLYLRD